VTLPKTRTQIKMYNWFCLKRPQIEIYDVTQPKLRSQIKIKKWPLPKYKIANKNIENILSKTWPQINIELESV
jgi:hypothetical protein